jgi:hypothetical protein
MKLNSGGGYEGVADLIDSIFLNTSSLYDLIYSLLLFNAICHINIIIEKHRTVSNHDLIYLFSICVYIYITYIEFILLTESTEDLNASTYAKFSLISI